MVTLHAKNEIRNMTDPKHIQIADYNYPLPDERIAKFPLEQRDQSKLLIYRHGEVIQDKFTSLPSYLPQGALMVFNNTKVIQARLHFHKETGAQIEVFCLEPAAPRDYALMFQQQGKCSWLCLVGNLKKWKEGPLHREITMPNGEILILSVTRGENMGTSFWITERRADRVTGDVVKVLKARFMVQFIGKTLVGVISNATNFGLFVNIERFKIDGLVHVSSLGNEYYVFEQSKNALVGSDSGRMYKVGDKVLVKITDVSVESGKVSMSLVKLANKVKPDDLPTLEFTPKESIQNNSVNEIIRSSMDKWNNREVLDIVNEVSGNIVAKKALKSFEVKKKHKVKKQKQK